MFSYLSPSSQVILPKPLPTPVAQFASLGGYTVVGRPGFPGQRPSKPRRIEPASNHTTANNAANRNANNQAANSGANHPPAAPRSNQPSATGGRNLQIISSSDVARSSKQGEVQTRPIEVICGPGGEASVRCEGTLSEVKDLSSINILSHLSFNRRMCSRFRACLPTLLERIQLIGLPSLKS